MKIYKFALRHIAAIAAVAVVAVGCSDSKDPDPDDGLDYDFTSTISTYVDDVVIPTYAEMKEKSWALYEAIKTLQATPTQPNLDAVCNAWLDVRAPWELSEAFLYGPCGEDGLNVDPNIDTWPFDMVEFNSIIGNPAEELSVAKVSYYSEGTRGYHTLEYLAFEDGHPKNINTMTGSPNYTREMQYMVAAAEVLRNDCIRVWAAWHGLDGLNTRDQQAIASMTAIGYWDVPAYLATKGASSYGEVFKQAKRPYTSKINVIEEIIDGCINIATEVAETKIESPYASNDVTLVESHYAYNSLKDFTDNIISIENSYFGKLRGSNTAATLTPAEGSLASFVRSQPGGAAIDADIVAAIATAKTKINAITAPFALNLGDAANIQAAVTACSNVERAMAKIKTLLL